MDAVKSFNDELSSIYETKPPVSRAKMTTLTKKAIKGIKFYKHIVQSMEKFIQKCRPEYKVPGLYVIDSVVRQSRHQFGQEKDVFMPRLCKNILTTFKHLYKCPPEEKQRIIRVLNLWQKNSVFPPDIVQQLLVMGGAPTPEASTSGAVPATQPPTQSSTTTEAIAAATKAVAAAGGAQPDASSLTNMLAQLLVNPDASQIQQLTGLLSNSQQAQLQALVHQVKGQQDQPEDAKPPPKPEPSPQTEGSSVFQPLQHNSQPPFLQSQQADVGHSSRAPPSFNRAVLDFDYSDDESPKANDTPRASQHMPQHPPPHHGHHSRHSREHDKAEIDMELLAKLPTVDQLQQITSTGQLLNGEGAQDQEAERRRRLEQEQEVFNKQIQQISNEFGEGDRSSSQDGRSSRSTSRRRRSRSRKKSRSRSRDRHKHRRRSRSRSHDRSRRSRRSHSKDRHRSHRRRSRSSEQARENEREREKKGLPPLREGFISLCSKTLWIGNLSAKVTQQEIKTEVEQHGQIESLNMIPPRGCAYICMEKREDASRALHKLRHVRMSMKALKVDWAPGKGVRDEYKEFWLKEHGVNYIPKDMVIEKLLSLNDQGFVDIESIPEEKRAEFARAMEPEVDNSTEGERNDPPQQQLQQRGPPMGMGPGMPQGPRPQGIMAGPGGMPVMMRPAFPYPGMNPPMGQFMPQQRMPGFQMRPNMGGPPRHGMPERADVPKPEGARTPTRDELPDGAAKAAAVAASIMSQVQPQMQAQLTMAQPRFQGQMPVGQVPVQIRMMPGMPHSPQVMPAQRLGMNVMPIRMNMPMHFRPGFPPGVRVPISSPHMMASPFQQMQMQRMGQMVQRMHQPSMQMPGAPMQIRGPMFQNNPLPEREEEKEVVVEEEEIEDPGSEGDRVGQSEVANEGPPGPGRRQSADSRTVEGDVSKRPLQIGERPPVMGTRPPMMGERGPPPGGRGLMGPRPGEHGLMGEHPPHPGDRGLMGDRPPIGDRQMGVRPPVDRPPPQIEDRPRMGDRPPRMDERPPPGGPGFRRSPPGRFGFDGRRPMDGPPERFPENDRFRDRDGGRDDRRRDDMRRRNRSRSRERDRRDRDMRDRRFERDDRGRDRRGGGFGDRGRDRPWMGDRGRFGGRDNFGRGRGRGGFGGGFRGRDEGRFQEEEEGDEEDLEYQRKREEVLRQRRQEEDNYVVEEVDLSAFGLPSGFGGVAPPEEEKEKDSREERRNDRDEDRRRDRDRDRDRREDRDRRDRDRDRRRDDRSRDDRRDSRRDRHRDSPDRRDDRRREDRGRDDREKNSGERDTKRRKVEVGAEASDKPEQTDTKPTPVGGESKPQTPGTPTKDESAGAVCQQKEPEKPVGPGEDVKEQTKEPGQSTCDDSNPDVLHEPGDKLRHELSPHEPEEFTKQDPPVVDQLVTGQTNNHDDDVDHEHELREAHKSDSPAHELGGYEDTTHEHGVEEGAHEHDVKEACERDFEADHEDHSRNAQEPDFGIHKQVDEQNDGVGHHDFEATGGRDFEDRNENNFQEAREEDFEMSPEDNRTSKDQCTDDDQTLQGFNAALPDEPKCNITNPEGGDIEETLGKTTPKEDIFTEEGIIG